MAASDRLTIYVQPELAAALEARRPEHDDQWVA